MITVSTIALAFTAAIYAVLGRLFSDRGQWGSAAALYGLAFFALLGALA
jgi:hypothetical protein